MKATEELEKRKQAIKTEREIREVRLKNWTTELRATIQELTEAHGFLSLLDMHRSKSKNAQSLSNSVSFLSTALTNLNKYFREETNEQ